MTHFKCIVLLSLLLAAAPAFADEEAILQEVVNSYRAGTFLDHRSDYAALYMETTDRSMLLRDIRSSGTRMAALYTIDLKRNGEPYHYEGVILFNVQDGHVVDETHTEAKIAEIDLALAGQMADVASTAVDVSSGLVEGNPVISGLSGSPGGLLAMAAIKGGMVLAASNMGYDQCVTARPVFGSLGFAATGWNIGLLVHPAIAVVAGIAGWALSYEKQQEDAKIRCLPEMGDFKYVKIDEYVDRTSLAGDFDFR